MYSSIVLIQLYETLIEVIWLFCIMYVVFVHFPAQTENENLVLASLHSSSY